MTFDEWAALFKKDPREFENKRKQVLDEIINQAPIAVRNNLRLLQMECDVLRTMYPPMEATVKISELMTLKLVSLQQELIKLKKELDE